jgi:hypothetical protein
LTFSGYGNQNEKKSKRWAYLSEFLPLLGLSVYDVDWKSGSFYKDIANVSKSAILGFGIRNLLTIRSMDKWSLAFSTLEAGFAGFKSYDKAIKELIKGA